MSDYNGWTNYATWRVKLEMFDSCDPYEEFEGLRDAYDLGQALKERAEEYLDQETVNGITGKNVSLVFSYAMAFLQDVNWTEIAQFLLDEWIENYPEIAKPFHVIGLDESGLSTILEMFDNSGEAKDWAQKYIGKENAGNWDYISVDDTREDCAETVWKWERETVD